MLSCIKTHTALVNGKATLNCLGVRRFTYLNAATPLEKIHELLVKVMISDVSQQNSVLKTVIYSGTQHTTGKLIQSVVNFSNKSTAIVMMNSLHEAKKV